MIEKINRLKIDLDSLSPEQIIEKGLELKKKGKVWYAAKCFFEVLKIEPKSIPAHMGIAKIALALKKYTDAEKHFRFVADNYQNHTKSLEQLANVLNQQKKFDEADITYKEILRRKKSVGFIDRATILQDVINHNNFTEYLEIGVYECINFSQMDVKTKYAVDPLIRIPDERKKDNNQLYEVPSDQFFKEQASTLSKRGIQAALVDGLHTYEQSLQDVLNTLQYLPDNGVIVMHDCKPTNAAAAIPDMKEAIKAPGFTGGWMGDVYKSILWLRSNRKDLNVCVLDLDCGLGYIRKGKPDNMLNLTDEQIKNMTFDELNVDMSHLLNMKSREYYSELRNLL